MKDFWYWAEEFDKKLITTALESGAGVILLSDPSRVQEVKALGRVQVASAEGADLIEGRDYAYVLIRGKEDEERAAKFPPHMKVIVETTDWTIIPLENLIAQREELYAVVKNEEEARLAVKVLEKGVKGIVLKTKDINTIKRVGKVLEEEEERLPMVVVRITRILPLGLGDRVCVDTTSMLSRGEGMLVGNSSAGMFLV
ncbi:MAG: 3-dehydroquinate synthase II, partial [Aquificota bacterium]